MTANRHAINPDRHSHRRHSERALWPDTPLASAYLRALTKWAITHHDDTDAQVTLPVGVVGAGDLMKVLRALEKARRANEHRA
jgi:hypothetical protein